MLLSNTKELAERVKGKKKTILNDEPLLSYIFNYKWLGPSLNYRFPLPVSITKAAFNSLHIQVVFSFFQFHGYNCFIARDSNKIFLKEILDKYSRIIESGKDAAKILESHEAQKYNNIQFSEKAKSRKLDINDLETRIKGSKKAYELLSLAYLGCAEKTFRIRHEYNTTEQWATKALETAEKALIRDKQGKWYNTQGLFSALSYLFWQKGAEREKAINKAIDIYKKHSFEEPFYFLLHNMETGPLDAKTTIFLDNFKNIKNLPPEFKDAIEDYNALFGQVNVGDYAKKCLLFFQITPLHLLYIPSFY